MTLNELKDLATIAAGIIAIFSLLKGLAEYSRDARHRRLQTLIHLRIRFTDSTALQTVREAIEDDDPEALSRVKKNLRIDFAALFEEVSLMLNSKLITENVAHSMFGFYAIQANESEAFWKGFNKIKNEIYWKPFTDFSDRMKDFEITHPVFNRSEYKV